MSLILDALNRSERDRQNAAAVPGLASEHYASTGAGSYPRRYLLWLTALFGLILLVGSWIFLSGAGPEKSAGENPGENIVESTASSSQPAPGLPPAQRPAATPPANAPNLTGAATTVVPPTQPAQRQAETHGISAEISALYADTTSAGRPTQSRDELEAQPDTTRTSAKKQPAPATATPASADQIDIGAAVQQFEQELENSRLAEHPAPFLTSLSQQRKDQIPTLMYSRHDYSSDAGTSSVVINGAELRPGQAVATGVTLVEILTDSVVLSFGGEEFRLRALSSWVNL